VDDTTTEVDTTTIDAETTTDVEDVMTGTILAAVDAEAETTVVIPTDGPHVTAPEGGGGDEAVPPSLAVATPDRPRVVRTRHVRGLDRGVIRIVVVAVVVIRGVFRGVGVILQRGGRDLIVVGIARRREGVLMNKAIEVEIARIRRQGVVVNENIRMNKWTS
jgi:hypothetical protein